MQRGATFHECLRNEALDDKCKTLRGAYKQCRMNWVDNRARIKGNLPGLSEREEKEAQAKFEKKF